MRYLLLLLLLPSLLGLSIARANGNEQQASQKSAQPEDFWNQAQQLTQEQSFLINRIEKAINEPDPNQVRAVRGQLTLHLFALDRFLKEQYPLPNLLCASLSPNVNLEDSLAATGLALDSSQIRVYCTLYTSTRKLTPLASVLDRRVQMLATVAEVKPLPLAGGVLPAIARARQSNSPQGIGGPADPVIATGTPIRPLALPANPLLSPNPAVPPSELPIIGRTAKQPTANYVPPIQPAIAPPTVAVATLQAARDQVFQAKAAFPNSVRFTDPEALDQAADRNAYGLGPRETQLYARFLEQPGTGVSRILPAEVYREPSNRLQNRVAPKVEQRFPFSSLLERPDGFTPRLTLQLSQGDFEVLQRDLNYGFMVNLGDVPIDDLVNLPANKLTLPSQTLKFFYSYRPPTELEAIQVDRRRFFTGKVGNFMLSEPLFSRLPAVLNQTYLVRLVQFDLPEVVRTGQTLTPRQRRYLDQLLETPGSDVLVAFRPVGQRPDGSYVILWRVLAQFPDPQITDLDEYVQF